MLDALCAQLAYLGDADMKKIERIAEGLPSIADLLESDMFIDCMTRDPDVAIVVAQARPTNAKSLYLGSVVGEFAYRSKEPAVIRTLEVGMPTTDMRGVTQEERHVQQTVAPIKNDEGKVIGALIAEKDVSKKLASGEKQHDLSDTTKKLIQMEACSRAGENCLPYYVTDGILMFNSAGVCSYANPVAEKIYKNLGYIEELEGLNFSNMTFHGVKFDDILQRKQINLNDLEVGGYIFHIKYTYIKNRNDGLSGVVMLINDVTDVKKKERELVHKTDAISEIHHRVKNNLQTIASLLKLQSRRIDGQNAKSAFNECINQVLSIAATHEILAEEGSDDVDIMTMLQKIKFNTLKHGLLANRGISINLKGDTFMCDSDMATSIALVINEVTQNCLKYAFDGRDSGKIDIEICNGKMYSNISVTDNGVGFDMEKERPENLGLVIVSRIVTEKLRGYLSTESDSSGTRVMFEFPLNSTAAKAI